MASFFKRIKESHKKRGEMFVGGAHVIMSSTPNVDMEEVLNIVASKVSQSTVSLIDAIYVGENEDLRSRNINAAYSNGAIYLLPEFDSVEDAVDDIVHELAHAIEDNYGVVIYGDSKVAEEFIRKRLLLRSILEEEGYDTSEYDFASIEYDQDLDVFLHMGVGYEQLASMCDGVFLNQYAATSLREYFATAFEHYVLDRYNSYVSDLCPGAYEKIVMIEEEENEFYS
jgi:hypothetical protein